MSSHCHFEEFWQITKKRWIYNGGYNHRSITKMLEGLLQDTSVEQIVVFHLNMLSAGISLISFFCFQSQKIGGENINEEIVSKLMFMSRQRQLFHGSQDVTKEVAWVINDISTFAQTCEIIVPAFPHIKI